MAEQAAEQVAPDEIDLFGREVARNLRELIADGTPPDEWSDYLQPAIEALLSCHFCGKSGLPSDPCCDDEGAGDA